MYLISSYMLIANLDAVFLHHFILVIAVEKYFKLYLINVIQAGPSGRAV